MIKVAERNIAGLLSGPSKLKKAQTAIATAKAIHRPARTFQDNLNATVMILPKVYIERAAEAMKSIRSEMPAR